jgi:hypothetical protein
VPPPEVPGILDQAEVAATVDSIAAVQLADGMIPWFPGGHCDPWNHVEAAMALAVGGRRAEAERAYQWLVGRQRHDGSWHHYYVDGGVEDPKFDANVCAYPATGVWHHYLATGDAAFLDEMWPMVERAIDFVLDLQTARGEIIWARHADGTPWSFALLTGSSSIFHSLRCAIAVAERLGHERPDWELSAATLGHVVARQPEAFAPKGRWAMDWYYPVLSGALGVDEGRARLAERWETFVMEGLGVRCVSDRPWVTAAETCECVMTLDAVGDTDTAWELFAWAQHLRAGDGSYWTGMAYPERKHFPGGERSTYTAAAVILAANVLCGGTPTSGLFRGETLPVVPDLSEDAAVAPDERA